MKYSKRFNRDYNFYLRSIGVFDFCGTLNPKHTAIPNGDKSAKECFYYIESEGKNYPCYEPKLLNQLLLTKASVNFQIKEWAQGRVDGTLPLIEFSKRQSFINSRTDWSYREYLTYHSNITVLEWINKQPVYFNDIVSVYKLPKWVIRAVENQTAKYIK